MRNKRKARAAKRERFRVVTQEPTDPDACTCCHEGLPQAWHSFQCPVSNNHCGCSR